MLDDETGRPRGILSPADREFLRASKSEREENYTRQGRSNRRREIRERVINAFLDFTLLERGLESDQRAAVFDAFDAKKNYSDDTDRYSSPEHQISCLTDLLAFVYRETREAEGRHPPFEMILEHGLTQGVHDPGTEVFNRYDVTIELEEIYPEKIDMKAVTERVKAGNIDQLTEAEMTAFIALLSHSDTFDPEAPKEVAQSLTEEYEDEWGFSPGILDQLLTGDPFPARRSSDETNE